MHNLRTFVALSVATLATACASPGSTDAASPHGRMAPMDMGGAETMAAMDPRMKSMQEMHQKMMNANTPAERQALMADHMKAMQGGLAMMKELQARQAESGTTGMGMMGSPCSADSMSIDRGMPPNMARRHRMMADHMALMQMMMDMMSDRIPPADMGK